MNRIIRSLLGSYTLEFPSADAPLLLNECKKRNIFFFSPLAKESTVTARASLFSCKSFLSLANELGIAAKITEKKGLPFILSRYRTRYGIYAGLLIGSLYLLFSSMFLWEVNVTGNVNISENEIKKILAMHGIAEGTFIPHIDADITAEYILLSYHPLSSLAINVKGTVANVDVIERVPIPEPVFPEHDACNLVAAYDGIITSVQAAEGHPEVKVGQVVTQGQLLVNGIVENRYGAFKVVNAKGYVYADVTHKLSFEIPLKTTVKKYTGKEKIKREIYFLGFPAKVYKETESPFDRCDVDTYQKRLTLFGLKTPFTVSKATYREYVAVLLQLSEEQAKALGEKRFNLWCEREAEGELVRTEAEEYTENGTYHLKISAVVNQNIALRKEMIIRNRP